MRYALISVGVFLTDLFIKNGIEKQKTEGETEELMGGRLLLRK